MKDTKNHFEELLKALDNINRHGTTEAYLSSIADKIGWCWKWKKITNEQKDILCALVIEICKSGKTK